MHRYVFSNGGNLRPSRPTKRPLPLARSHGASSLLSPPSSLAISGPPPCPSRSFFLSLLPSSSSTRPGDRLDACLCLARTQPPPSAGACTYADAAKPIIIGSRCMYHTRTTRIDSTLVESAPDASATHTSKTTPSIDRALHCHPRPTTRRDATNHPLGSAPAEPPRLRSIDLST